MNKWVRVLEMIMSELRGLTIDTYSWTFNKRDPPRAMGPLNREFRFLRPILMGENMMPCIFSIVCLNKAIERAQIRLDSMKIRLARIISCPKDIFTGNTLSRIISLVKYWLSSAKDVPLKKQ